MSTPFQDAIRTIESPQPAIIIGVGAFGQAVRDRITLQRDVYRGFKTPLAGEDAGSVYTRILPSNPAIFDDKAEDIRADQLTEQTLRDIARDLRQMFNTVRLHRDAPLFDTLRPVIIVVGATWSEAGRALLWPLSAIIRAAIGSSMQYTLYGVFVSADYRADASQREDGEANTWSVFDEGDRLAAGEVIWQGKVRAGIGSDGYDTRLYDNIFWIDGHKENNGSIGQDDDVFEVATHVSSLLEGMVYSALPRTIDQALLDDHNLTARQLYIGVGSASLVVPLRDITTLVRRYTLGTLIRDRLLTAPPATSDVNTTLLSIITRMSAYLSENARKSIGALALEASKGPFTHNTTLNVDVSLSANDKTVKPNTDSVTVTTSASDPFDEQLTAEVILARQFEAQEQSTQLLQRFSEALARDRFSTAAEAEAEAGRSIAVLLSTGGTGLLRSVETLKDAARILNEHYERLESQAITEAKTADRVYARITDRRTWFGVNPEIMLKRAVDLRAHLPAMLIRAAILIAILFQLYWDSAWKARTALFPMQLFDFTYADPLSLWSRLLFMTTLIVIIPTLLIWALPYIGVAWQQRWRKKQLESYLQMRTNALLASHTAVVASVVQSRLRNQRAEELAVPLGELMAQRDSALRATSPDAIERDRLFRKRIDYLESAVVDPVDVMVPFQTQVADSIVARYGTNVVSSWRPRGGTIEDPWKVEDIADIVNRLEAQIDPVVSDITTKTIDEYLVDQDILALMHRLWRSSVPWLKATHDYEVSDTYSRLRIDALMVSRRVRPFFEGVIDGPDGSVIPVDWPDAHRVMMLRMYCGIVSSEVARWRQLEAAGEHARREQLKQFRVLPKDPVAVIADVPEPSLRVFDSVRTVVTKSVDVLREAFSAPSIPVNKSILLIMATQKYIAFAEKELPSYESQAHPIEELRRVIPLALRPYDLFYSSQADEETKVALGSFNTQVSELLMLVGLEVFAPENGTLFDISSGAVKTETSDRSLPANVIKKCLAQGYRWRSTLHVELQPYVQVNNPPVLTKKVADA
ncbi:MAG: hypothetical protein RLY87_1123 [Chloroflexota bacterium]